MKIFSSLPVIVKDHLNTFISLAYKDGLIIKLPKSILIMLLNTRGNYFNVKYVRKIFQD